MISNLFGSRALVSATIASPLILNDPARSRHKNPKEPRTERTREVAADVNWRSVAGWRPPAYFAGTLRARLFVEQC
jgi:hypothetical protein